MLTLAHLWVVLMEWPSGHKQASMSFTGASKQRNDPLKDFFPGLVWKCARPHVCAHLPESERSLVGLYVLVLLCVSRVTQQSNGIQPPPQHLAHRHLIKACFSEYLV